MKSRKMPAFLLVIAMLLTLLPATVSSADAIDTDGALITNKHTVLEDNGSYTISIEAYSTGSVSEISVRKPTDIIIVMDVSGSMNDPDWATDGEASWQQYNGWFTTAMRLQNEGQVFYCNQHSDYYRQATLLLVEDYTLSSGDVCDIFGYYCSYCGTKATANSTSFSKYAAIISSGGDYMLGDNFDLYRKTSDVTRIEAMKEAVNAFIDTTAAQNVGVEEDQQHRIALVKYAGYRFNGLETGNNYYFTSDAGKHYSSTEFGATATVDSKTYTYNINCTQTLYESAYVNSSNKAAMQEAVNGLNAGGATYAHEGIYLAYTSALSNLETQPDREQIVLFFTDGEPTTKASFDSEVANTTISYAKAVKSINGTKIYTVNMMPESASTADMTKYMNYVSSNYPEAESLTAPGSGSTENGYYKQVHDMDDLNALFDDISKNISSTSINLDSGAQLRDYLAEGFFLTDDARVEVSIADYEGNNTWSTAELVQKYPDAIEDSPVSIQVDQEAGSIFVDGFSYKDNYIHEEYMSGNRLVPAGGQKLIVTIYDVNATDEAVQNGYVDTNLDSSGIYSDGEQASSFVQPLPVPEVLLTSKTYVWDYGRPAFLSSSDWHQSSVSHLGRNFNTFQAPNTTLELDYGTAAIPTNAANGFTYFPKTMQWGGYDTLYVLGKGENNANTWAKVNIVPANNVYYEDDFIAGDLNVEDGIVYTDGSKPQNMSEEEWAKLQNGWQTTGNGEGAQEDPNGAVHGWIAELSEAAGYSDGVAHIVAAVSGQSNAELPSARFTFTGTGMDIYSFTDSTTGTILVSVAKRGGSTSYYVVDNYAASGAYYQIPTVTYSGDYGTYDVTIYVTAAAASEDRFTFYLDGIRVYNPLGSTEDEIISEAYAGEMNAVFSEVRNMLSAGAVFIDKDAEGNTSVEMNYNDSDYALYAPEHEVYLDSNQSVTFAVADGNANYYIGLKALAGGSTTAWVGNGNSLADIKVGHTTDLYYKVTPYYDSTTGKYVITVKNAGDKLLAITKLRQTSAGATAVSLQSLSQEEALYYSSVFERMEVRAYEASSQVQQVEIQQPAPQKDELTVQRERLQRLTEKLFAGLAGWF